MSFGTKGEFVVLPRAPTTSRTSSTDHLIGIGLGAAIFGLFALELLRELTIAKLSVPFIVAAYAPLLVLHEAGHALAAWLVGARVCKVVIGMGRPLWRFRVLGAGWCDQPAFMPTTARRASL